MRQTLYRWRRCLFLLTVPVWLGGCLTTSGTGGSADTSSYRHPGAEYERTDDLPTPQLLEFRLQLPDRSTEP